MFPLESTVVSYGIPWVFPCGTPGTIGITIRPARALAPRQRTPEHPCSSFWQDHIGAAGLVADYFAADEPLTISSRRTRWTLKGKAKADPNTLFGNNRGVPIPEWYEEDMLDVGGLRFFLDKAHMHQAGDYMIHLDKSDPSNANEGIIQHSTMCNMPETDKESRVNSTSTRGAYSVERREMSRKFP